MDWRTMDWDGYGRRTFWGPIWLRFCGLQLRLAQALIGLEAKC